MVTKFLEALHNLPNPQQAQAIIAEASDLVKLVSRVDLRKLNVISEILRTVGQMPQDPESLRSITQLTAEINAMSDDKLKAILAIVKGADKLSQKLPKEMLKGDGFKSKE